MTGAQRGSVTIHRVGDYAVEYELSALEDIAALTKKMPDHFIAASGSDITDAFQDYLRPLLGSGLPDIGRLKNEAVPKIG